MSWFFKLLGAAGLTTAEVDSNSQLMITTNQDPTKIGGTRLYDAGGNAILVEENGALSVSQDELLFIDQIDGNAVNTNKWTSSTSGMTIAQASGFITLNSGMATTPGAYAILQSIMQIPLYGDMPVEYGYNIKINVPPTANLVMEVGFGSATGTATPTDGCFLRWTSAAQFQAVANNNGTETPINCALPAGSTNTLPPVVNDSRLYTLIVAEDHIQFTYDDEIIADIQNPAAFAYPVSAGHQPIFFRVYNGGSAPSQAGTISIGQAAVRQISVQTYKSWRDRMSSMGMGAYQSPATPFGQTANHANSSGPASATLSNTAAGYTTLGGKWQFAAVAGAATDFALFAYQVPTPFRFYVTDVVISSLVTGAAIGVTPTILDWSLGVNASAVSLATADGAGTWAPRRIPLGMQGLLAAALIGTPASDITRRFDPPLMIDAGRFLHVILQIPVGLATVSQILRGTIFINGYFE